MRVIGLLLLLPAIAGAQASKPDDPISPSRPDFTQSPEILPVRTVQLEFGLTRWARLESERPRTELGETTVRYGLARNTELRADLPTYILSDDRSGRGWNDLRLYAVHYVGQIGGIDIGLLPGLTIPAGTPDVGEGQFEPELNLLLQSEIGGGRSIAGTCGTAYARRNGQDASRSSATLELNQGLGRGLSLFAEFAGFYTPHESPRNFAHVGAVLNVGRNAAVDLHAGIGLNASAERNFLGAGYSVRF